MEQLIDQISQKHKALGIELRPPAAILDIEEFERQIGFPLPFEFVEFYLVCNGFSCEVDLFNMLSINEMRDRQYNRGINWLYFSEYMIYSDIWGLRLSFAGSFEIFNASFPEKHLTSSLTEFLKRFLEGNVFEEGGLYDWQKELGIGQ